MEYIENIPIYELFTGAERMPVSIRCMRWRYQDLNPEEEGDSASEGVEREAKCHGGSIA